MKATLNFVVMVLFFTVCINVIHAQEKQTRVRTNEGNFAVGFDIRGLGDFEINGGPDLSVYSISGRKFISDNLALVASVGFASSSNLTDTTGSSSTYYSVAVGVQKHWPMFTHNTSFYAQAVVGYAGGSETSAGYEPPDEGSIFQSHQQPQALSAGQTKDCFSGIVGSISAAFDWYIFDFFAIGTSYGLHMNSFSHSEETSSGTTDEPSSSSFGIFPQGSVHMLIAF